ncbi:hypothetical protein FQV39_30225 (plasmid) [Bosea sp. F3-2]|uniref:hypothetical protein n=1 Tax=Bosea sp. F3-2 TaxID=2599640 RepID=UPI0011F01F4B|nr:hypothetical protein [Bosea sp. F3-2]QEL26935.1 hypothetical protein FQV39_30225 [Bosea sp. F3-2]
MAEIASEIAPERHNGLTFNDEQAGLLDPCEFELIRQAATTVFSSGDECEIEQMLRLRDMLPVRRRIQLRPERDLSGLITAMRIVVERDGEPVADWTVARGDEYVGDSGNATSRAVEAIDAFMAIMLHAGAVKRHLERSQWAETANSADHILANVQRAWRQVGGYCRKHAVPAS